MPKLYSGAEIVFKCLEEQKVEFIFGYPGGAVLPIYDELKNHSSIKHILFCDFPKITNGEHKERHVFCESWLFDFVNYL